MLAKNLRPQFWAETDSKKCGFFCDQKYSVEKEK